MRYRKALYQDVENSTIKSDDNSENSYQVFEGNRLHFIKFETRHIESCLDFVKANLVNVERFQGTSIQVTGGGAYKYTQLIQEKLGTQ